MKKVVILCSAALALVIAGSTVAIILFLHQTKVDAASRECRDLYPSESSARSECLFDAQQW